MDSALTEEQVAIRDTCREFAEQEIQPRAQVREGTSEVQRIFIARHLGC